MFHDLKKRLKKWAKNNTIINGLHGLFKDYFSARRCKFGNCSDDCNIIPPLYVDTPHNLFLLGNNVLNHATIINRNAKFVMMQNSVAAYGLTVVTGNHVMKIGRNFCSITEDEKPKGYDKDVIVEEDVWIGCNVTLLSGVIIGRGSTVAAGAVVTKSFPPYSLIGGCPARHIKFKWTIDEILEHERILYPEHKRITRERLEEIFDTYIN